ncbi:MAG: extracellular solute-binding protein [bacterium]|nr:extracellular solute-binding protein [bacterium]
MKKFATIAIVTVSMFVLTVIPSFGGEGGKFGLADIPDIQDKTKIHVALEAGGSGDTILPFLKKFEEQTGVPVTHEMMVFSSMYSKEIVELQGRTGGYDLVIVETSWTNEWDEYLHPIRESAKKYDPQGTKGLEEDIAHIDAGLLRCASTSEGKLIGLPYYQYTLINIYRQDVFEDPTEMAAFKEKYGYDLAPPTTWEQLHEMAEFFTRKKGGTLKGEILDKDIYGLSMMAGRFPHVQDEVGARLWSTGNHWASPVREDGKLVGFKVTDEDKKALEWAFQSYVDDMPYSPPGTENAFWDFAGTQFAAGNTMMMPHQYTGLWNWMVSMVDKDIPGGKVAAAPVVGKRPYTGAFYLATTADSKNPEAAYWLMRYISSYEAQKAMGDAGGWPVTRRDVLADALTEKGSEGWNASWGDAEAVLDAWEAQTPDINDYLHFNSKAFGKLYEMMTIVGHENAVGKRSPAESVEEWIKQFTKVQNKYGILPVVD